MKTPPRHKAEGRDCVQQEVTGFVFTVAVLQNTRAVFCFMFAEITFYQEQEYLKQQYLVSKWQIGISALSSIPCRLSQCPVKTFVLYCNAFWLLILPVSLTISLLSLRKT